MFLLHVKCEFSISGSSTFCGFAQFLGLILLSLSTGENTGTKVLIPLFLLQLKKTNLTVFGQMF